MFFSFSFPLEENLDVVQLKKKLNQINLFFRLEANLSGKYQAFSFQILTSIKENHIEDHPEYYISFNFFNSCKKRQKELELLYHIGFNKELYEKLQIDASALSYISSIPLYNVFFSHDENNLNIAINFSDEHCPALKSHLSMLFNNFKKTI